MARPTIRDVATAAGVSVATVNRVIASSGHVRPQTAQRVLEAARAIGFYGAAALQHRVEAQGPAHRLGVIVQTPHSRFAEALEGSLARAARANEDGSVMFKLEHVDDLAPEQVSSRMLAMAESCDAVAVLAAEHPIVADAIDRLAAQGVPVVALVTPLSARSSVGYVGLDNWKVGRAAAWVFDHLCRDAGKLAILVGTHRYRCHDLRESGFRSYFREHGSRFTLLEPQSTFESDAIARELTEGLLRAHPDLDGLYVAGGGIAGVLAAIRAERRSGKLVTVGYDLMETTKAGLLDGSLTFVLSHPFDAIARSTIAATIRARNSGQDSGNPSVFVPFEMYMSENI